MKVIDKSHLETTRDMLASLATEREMLTNTHPFLLHMESCFQTATSICFVTDFVPGGDLYCHLTTDPDKYFPGGNRINKFGPKMVKFIGAQLVLALEHLHASNIVYRDLKLENILVDREGYILLADFGLCKELKRSLKANTFCGTPDYMAPEVARGEEYSKAVDWWGVGVILYELTVGKTPFTGPDIRTVLFNILTREVIYPQDYFHDNFRSILEELLRKDPRKRIQDPADIKRSLYFKNLDWGKLLVKKVPPPYNILEKNSMLRSPNPMPAGTQEITIKTLGASTHQDLKDFEYSSGKF